MAEEKTREALIRQWRLVELVRRNPQGKSIKSLLKELKVSKATLDSDLSVLEEAELVECLKISDEIHVLYEEDTSSPPCETSRALLSRGYPQ